MGEAGLVSFWLQGTVRVPDVATDPRTAKIRRALGVTPVCVGVLRVQEARLWPKLGWRRCGNELVCYLSQRWAFGNWI